ncbi:uncharacterized protein TNIN_161291 [Trichonephila inaurata madagascariensis]|uniref:Uncharacterized protein n=1 Tax=Trichonephila inaurata madagascariensis TaxID=2747483 RepID=A0A8X6XJ20_9ARAC|nr:uncharacterized protein TNIN_161291 [Trichonephila inaurata madagascariensis]
MRNSFYHTLYSLRQQIHQHNDNKLETMSSMGLLNFYLILIVVLVICEEDSGEEILRHGLRNPAFDDLEFPNRLGALPEQRPFSIMEAMESPPSYEEAVKQELFRFRTPPSPQRQRSSSLTDINLSEDSTSPTAGSSEGSSSTFSDLSHHSYKICYRTCPQQVKESVKAPEEELQLLEASACPIFPLSAKKRARKMTDP